MNAKPLLNGLMSNSDRLIKAYVSDLTAPELLIRPVPGMNHIAWQLGHLIATERHFLEMIEPGASPDLPEGFNDGHGRNSFEVDDPSKFYETSRYLELWDAQRAATLGVLEGLTDSGLDDENPKFPPMAPTKGQIFALFANHPMMHAGQFVAVRRHLNKPIAI